MSSPTHLSTNIDHKYASMHKNAMQHIQKSKSRNHAKESLVSDRTMSSPLDDFILFPDDMTKRNTASCRGAQRRNMAEEAMRNPFSPKSTVADAKLTEQDPSRRKRPLRHGGFRIVPLVDDDRDKCEECTRPASKRPPPAPSPPRLETPELSDVDEDDFWSSGRRTVSNKRRSEAPA